MEDYYDNELTHYPYSYDAGNNHLVYVGEVYNNRYRVCRKLGFGATSTVWLVKDIAARRYLAMKVLSAMAYSGVADLYELEILQYLAMANPRHPGHAHTLQLLDHFDHVGTGGTHRCLIFPVMGESLVTYVQKFRDNCVPAYILKRLTKQLLQAIDYAHSHGVIHTDIKPENIMIRMKDESVIANRYIPTTEGCTDPEGLEPDSETELSFLFWPNSARLHPSKVPCIPMANYYMGQKPTREAFGEVELVLSDWGVATWAEPSRRRTDDVVPLLLQSPELLLQAPWDAKVDIWATACIFLGLAEGERLFNGQGPLANGWGYDPEWHLAEIAEVLGDFPTSLLQTGNPDIVNYAFDGQGKLIAARPHRNPPLHEWIAHIWGESRDQFIDLLYGMLTLDPDHRPSAGELLEAPWFAASQTNTTKKALPEQEVKVDLDAVQSESGMALTEKHVTIAPNGTGYVTPEDDQHAPDDHVQKKVKLSSAGIAMPDRREVRDLPMEDIDNVSAAEEVDLDLLMRDPPAGDPKQPPASDAETPVNTSTQDDSGASNSFLDVSGNGAKSDTAEIVDSKALQRPYWAEVIRGGYWFAKEVVVFVLGRL